MRYIAQIYNVDKATIAVYLNKAGIHIRNKSESQIGKVVSVTTRERLAKLRKGTHFTEEQKKKQRQNQVGKHDYLRLCGRKFIPEDEKEALRKRQRVYWQNPEYAHKVLSANNKRPNKIEKRLLYILDILFPDEWVYVGDGSLIIGGKCPDSFNIVTNTLVELFGDYWHRGENPQNRIDEFKKYGYSTLVLWEKEVKNFDVLMRKLYEFMV